jgi:hypothetical protein
VENPILWDSNEDILTSASMKEIFVLYITRINKNYPKNPELLK